MELSLSGNALKTLHRSVTCLSRVGGELVLQATPSLLIFHTINSSRTAYQSISFKPDFFDFYNITSSSSSSAAANHGQVQCSVLLKAVCSILRTPVTAVDRLSVLLSAPDSPKLQWTLDCYSGMRKTYWITCNVEPDIHQLSLDRTRFPSSLVVRPRDLGRLLANFQSSLHEITVIATDPTVKPDAAGGEISGKAVELRSYIDPMKDDSDMALHTQLWIDPAEEFLHYTHAGDPVDVTFSMKELKAFLSFCEGCEVDIHLFFEKAGEPILMTPKFGFDDGSNSDFDATLVLCTMLASQLHEGNTSEHPPVAPVQDAHRMGSQSECARTAISTPAPNHSSNHTKIWSELSGSAVQNSSAVRERQAQLEKSPNFTSHNGMPRSSLMDTSAARPIRENEPDLYPDCGSCCVI